MSESGKLCWVVEGGGSPSLPGCCQVSLISEGCGQRGLEWWAGLSDNRAPGEGLELGRRKREAILWAQSPTQKPRIPSSGLPSLKSSWPLKLSQVTMTTIQQLHFGSPKGPSVADEYWLEHSVGSTEPSQETRLLPGKRGVAGKARSAPT